MPKDKNGAALVIGLGPKKEESGPNMEDGAKEMAAQELIDAVSDGSPSDVAAAFKTMYDLCSEDEGENEEY